MAFPPSALPSAPGFSLRAALLVPLFAGLCLAQDPQPSQDPAKPGSGETPGAESGAAESTAPADGTQDPGDERVVVTAKKETGYLETESSVATRSDTPLDELPYSVRTLPQEFASDIAARDLSDVTRYAAGVTFENIGGFLGANDTAFIRGFRNRFLYYNGFLLEAIPSVNPTTLDRVEVLKGPSSVLYGTMEPGGVINLVSKKARADDFLSINQRFGSWNFHESTLDAGGALTDDGDVRYRLHGGFRDNESFRNRFRDQRQWGGGSVAWDVNDELTLSADFLYSEQKRVIDEGVAFSAAGQPVGGIDVFLGDPGFPGQRYSQWIGELHSDWQLTRDVRWHSGFLASNWANDMNGVRRSAPTQPDNTVNRLFEDSDFDQDTYQWINSVNWTVDTGGIEHEFGFGLDMRWRQSDLELQRGAAPPVSITDPSYGFPAPDIDNVRNIEQEQDWYGIYLQDQFDLLDDDLHANVAARYDYVDQSSGPPDSRTSTDDDAFTFRGGLLYDITEEFGVYGSVGQSFVPQSPGTQDSSGSQLDPETGLQFEAGVKMSWLDRRLWSTLAVYQLTKDDVAITDPNDPQFAINAGELRSRGVELEIAGDVTERLSVVGSYAYTDTTVRKSDRLPIGSSFRNVPEHSGSIWGKYALGTVPGQGLSVGLGLQAMSERTGDDQSSFHLPSFWTVDTGIFYKTETAGGTPIDLQVNVINLFNEQYYQSSLANSRVFPGSPRAFYATMGVVF